MADNNEWVAAAILQHLGGMGKLQAMLGASSFARGNFDSSDYGIKGPGLSFRIKANAKNKAKAIIVVVNGKDLYDVRFFAMRGFECKVVGELNDVGAEQLKLMVAEKLGLDLSL